MAFTQDQLYRKWENYVKQKELEVEWDMTEDEDIMTYDEFENWYLGQLGN